MTRNTNLEAPNWPYQRVEADVYLDTPKSSQPKPAVHIPRHLRLCGPTGAAGATNLPTLDLLCIIACLIIAGVTAFAIGRL